MQPAGRPRRARRRSDPVAPGPRTSDAAVERATGKSRATWFALLDAWGAAARAHRDVAGWLMAEHGVGSWWAQTLTVDYEQARGLRAPGGARDGTFTVGVSRTVAVPAQRLFDAFVDATLRRRWLPGAVLRERTSIRSRSARFDWKDDGTRVIVGFTPKGRTRSQVALNHERLRSARAAREAKAYWSERMAALKALLER